MRCDTYELKVEEFTMASIRLYTRYAQGTGSESGGCGEIEPTFQIN